MFVEAIFRIAGAERAILERHSFRVHVALDGDSGLDALLEATYDAAGVDLLLPG